MYTVFTVFRKQIAYIGSFAAVGMMVVFFGFHTIAGDRGSLARPELERKIQLAEEQLVLLKKHHSFLVHRISLMQDESIDADMLEETAQSELGLYSPNDVIISIDLSDLKY